MPELEPVLVSHSSLGGSTYPMVHLYVESNDPKIPITLSVLQDHGVEGCESIIRRCWREMFDDLESKRASQGGAEKHSGRDY